MINQIKWQIAEVRRCFISFLGTVWIAITKTRIRMTDDRLKIEQQIYRDRTIIVSSFISRTKSFTPKQARCTWGENTVAQTYPSDYENLRQPHGETKFLRFPAFLQRREYP